MVTLNLHCAYKAISFTPFHPFQAVGHCDGNDAQTELFNIYDVDGDGKVISQKYQRHYKNGTIVDVTILPRHQ